MGKKIGYTSDIPRGCKEFQLKDIIVYTEYNFAQLLFDAIDILPSRCAKVCIKRKRTEDQQDNTYTITADVNELCDDPLNKGNPFEGDTFAERPRPDYSMFAFDTLTIPMIARLFIESKLLGDKDFADACFKQLQTRKE